jgi:hypothetical protein
MRHISGFEIKEIQHDLQNERPTKDLVGTSTQDIKHFHFRGESKN